MKEAYTRPNSDVNYQTTMRDHTMYEKKPYCFHKEIIHSWNCVKVRPLKKRSESKPKENETLVNELILISCKDCDEILWKREIE